MHLRALGILLGLAAGCAQAQAAEVDMALVLAIDASHSVGGGVFDLQVDGHAKALANPAFLDAVGAGGQGGIAVTVIQYSDPDRIVQPIPWTEIRNAEDAQALADAIAGMEPMVNPGSTAIARALDFGARLFAEGGYDGVRRVIDLSSNGFDNISVKPDMTRDRLVAEGITINGIVILDEYEWLPEYFAKSIIGGNGAFVMSADGAEDYERVLLAKLVAEIVGTEPTVRLAAAEAP